MPKISLSTSSVFLKMSYRRAMNFAVQNGFEGIEIWSSAVDFWPRTVTSKEIDLVRSIAKENHLDLAVHYCTVNNNLCDLNVGHLNESMNQLKETIRLCRRIGGQVVVVHPGTCPDILLDLEGSVNPKVAPAALKHGAVERFKKSLLEAALFAESHDVVIGLENYSEVRGCLQSNIEDIAEWVDEINNPALQITLDIGYAHKQGDVARAIHLLDHRIRHIHLHDSDRENGGEHKELGTGTVDWKSIAGFLKSFPGMLCLDVLVRGDLEGAVLRSRNFLGELLAR